MLSPHKISYISTSAPLFGDPKGAIDRAMSTKSKKRAVLTAKEYLKLVSKRSKTNNFSSIVTSDVIAASPSPNIVPVLESTQHNSALHDGSASYYVYPPSKGVDLSVIRNNKHSYHSSKPNIASIMSKATQYSFVHVTDKPVAHINHQTTTLSTSRRSKPHSVNRSTSTIQTSISSYFSVIGCSNNLSHNTRFHPLSILYGKSRCVVEDFMTLPPKKPVVIIIPTTDRNKYAKPILSALSHCLHLLPIVQYGSKSSLKYYIVSGYVKSNPQYAKCIDDTLSPSEIRSAYNTARNNGYGCVINLNNIQNTCTKSKSVNVNILIKWIEVLNGKTDGVQVWCELEKKRDFTNNIASNCSISLESSSHTAILSYLYEEIFCDAIAIQQLLSKYYKTLNMKRREFILKLNDKNKLKKVAISLNMGNKYFFINETIESTFKNAIVQCYTDFSEISCPILSREDINKLVTLYKNNAQDHYIMMKNMLGFDKKEKEKRNDHLKVIGYYDRILFYQYLVLSRLRYSHMFSYWGLINSCSIYGKGGGKGKSQTTSFFGHSVCNSTFMRKTKVWREDLSSSIHMKWKDEPKVLCCLDNNQKGHPLKFQRYGKSNKYVKVTGSVLINYHYCCIDAMKVVGNSNLTYVDQAIPSPFLMPHYETLKINDHDNEGIITINHDDMLNAIVDITTTKKQDRTLAIYRNGSNETIDFTGERVNTYMLICKRVALLDMIRMGFSGMYSTTANKFKAI